MRWHFVRVWMVFLFQFLFIPFTVGEDVFRETFDNPPHGSPLIQTWGDEAAAIESNGVVARIGVGGSSAARLKISYPSKLQHGLSYWTYHLSEPIPLVPQLERISFAVKSTVPVSIKIGIKPFGFIYHGPGVKASDQWQEVTLVDAYEELKEWCANGGKSVENGWVSSIIVAVESQAGKTAELLMVLAASQHRVNNRPVVSTIDLDNRPQYYEWPEEIRRTGPYPDPVKQGIPEQRRIKMYGRFNRPAAKGDLRSVILTCRRPELYLHSSDRKPIGTNEK